MVSRSKNKVIKSVSFNITNDKDVECLKHIKDKIFSGYVKELILADIRRKEAREKAKGGIKAVVGR